MNNKLILFFIILFSVSCSSTLFINKKSEAEHINTPSFNVVDANNDGKITEIEFHNSQEKHSIDAQTPMLWFFGIILITFVLLFFSSRKKCNKMRDV